MGLLLRRLFPRLSRHKPRRDEDLQGRPARPEAEAARANVQAVMVRHYMDRTKEKPTPRRPWDHYSRQWPFRRWGSRRSYTRSHWPAKGRFGNPRWMRAEGVTPLGISSRRIEE
jgi:hypothetical protein